MSYILSYDAARTANFLKILEVALVHAATSIINEVPTAPNHYNRVFLATDVLRDASAWAAKFKDSVADQGVTDVSLDSAFDIAISVLWNGFAGITHNGSLV